MEENPQLSSLSPTNSVNRINNNDPHSPEFEFWMVRNPSFPQTSLLSADELIVDGVLLPLDLVSPHSEPPDSDPKPNTTITIQKQQEPRPGPGPESELLSQPGPGPESATTYSSSKRWRDIFKMGEKRACQSKEEKEKEKDNTKEKKKDRKAAGGGGSASASSGSGSAAELNINIWPFSRSWSGGNRSRIGGGGTVSRKVSSAPCSRSNSAGESKSRKWPNSPSRGGGVHLGRNSPVWQLRRGGSGLKHSENVVVRNGVQKGKNKSGGGEVGGSSKSRGGGGLNLNVPMCIGYRQQLSCRRDDNILLGSGGDNGGGAENGGGGGVVDNGGGGNKLLYLRTLFTKKVY